MTSEQKVKQVYPKARARVMFYATHLKSWKIFKSPYSNVPLGLWAPRESSAWADAWRNITTARAEEGKDGRH